MWLPLRIQSFFQTVQTERTVEMQPSFVKEIGNGKLTQHRARCCLLRSVV